MDPHQNDTELWQLVKAGNAAAFDRMYHLYVSPIFAMVYKHIGNRVDAEDITQEVFLEIWEKRMDIFIQQSLFNYLYSAARYKTLRHIKINSLRPESLDLLQKLLSEADLPQVQQDVYPEPAILAIESTIAKEIASLPDQMKKVYLLSQEKGLSISDISGQLAISAFTVKNHLAKVRKRLRQTISHLSAVFFTLIIVFLLIA